MGPNLMTCVLIKRGNLQAERTPGEHHMEMKSEMGGFPTSQGTPKPVSHPPEARREAWGRFSLPAFGFQ